MLITTLDLSASTLNKFHYKFYHFSQTLSADCVTRWGAHKSAATVKKFLISQSQIRSDKLVQLIWRQLETIEGRMYSWEEIWLYLSITFHGIEVMPAFFFLHYDFQDKIDYSMFYITNTIKIYLYPFSY